MQLKRRIAVVWFSLVLTACTSHHNMAPVVDSKWRSLGSSQEFYRVRPGDTLFSIAFRNDMDYRRLANLNHLNRPYIVKVGQLIRLRPGRTAYQRPRYRPMRQQYTNKPRYQRQVYSARTGTWLWPAKGNLVSGFIPQQGKKGIDIAGKRGSKIFASSSGVVAYAGDGLSGYGNLIIIKHNNQFLTAYGHNQRNLVHEGQFVKAGQQIADMGVIEGRFWGLHFEIRRNGVPVNPLNYLKRG